VEAAENRNKTAIIRRSIDKVKERTALIRSPKRYDLVNSKVRTNLVSQQKTIRSKRQKSADCIPK